MTASSEENSFSDWVCAICDDGGDIISCRGSCLRSFHVIPDPSLRCRTLKFTKAQVEEMKVFLCDNCRYQKHQCYACGVLGSSSKSDREVYMCGSPDCGLHYHPDCVAKLLQQGDVANGTQLAEKIKEGGVFKCPRHLCHICRCVENKEIKDLQFAICRRCPIAYHRRCLPREIIFEDKDKDTLQRAWEGLLPDRVLIYCMKHNIDKDLRTARRNHLQFPSVQITLIVTKENKSRMKEIPKSYHQSPAQKKQRITFTSLQARGPKVSAHGEKRKAFNSANSIETRLPRSSFPQISEITENKMRAFLEEESSSVTIETVRKKLNIPSIYSNSQKQIIESISEEEVTKAVESARAACAKLRTGGNIEEAKAICHPDTLSKIIDWRSKLSVYLAPFLFGSRYTSFGRHFTKVDKLMEIVDKLHWYVQDGDMVVDFCCGSNDFSILMRDKLTSVGKKCFFKNFDLQQPKNDFNFEKRDWMTVQPEELPEGSRLIVGLNPPFGVRAALANKFINQALKFKPKILILIVPKETKRLDAGHEYTLTWHDPFLLSGKSFYLPGLVDNKHNQEEQLNYKPPPLYLWSHSDWAQLHRQIAYQHGHLSEDYLANKELVFTNQPYYNIYEEAEVAELSPPPPPLPPSPPPPPPPMPPIIEAGNQIGNKEDDPHGELDAVSDMSISTPEPDVKSYPRGPDDVSNVGLRVRPSTSQLGGNIPEVVPSNLFDYGGPPGFDQFGSNVQEVAPSNPFDYGGALGFDGFGSNVPEVAPSNPFDYWGAPGFNGSDDYWFDGK